MDVFVSLLKSHRMVYHYTTFNRAMTIMESHSLLFGRLYKMNDLQESTRLLMSNSKNTESFIKCKQAVQRYRQISLTTEERTGRKKPLRGFDILPMWGHYADKGHGVCIALDSTVIRKTAEFIGARQGIVSYRRGYDNAINFDSDDPAAELREGTKNKVVFFQKSPEWSYEQEYRLIIECPSDTNDEEVPLDITKAIVAVIIAKLNGNTEKPQCYSPGYDELAKICSKMQIPILLYGADAGQRFLNYAPSPYFGAEGRIWTKDTGGKEHIGLSEFELMEDRLDDAIPHMDSMAVE